MHEHTARKQNASSTIPTMTEA